MHSSGLNLNPTIRETAAFVQIQNSKGLQEITRQEVFELVRHIKDPEHPFTLEQLGVVELDAIEIENQVVRISITPTIPHCSMITLIGLCVKVQLLRLLPKRFRIILTLKEGSHTQINEVNKQLSDKERIAAALENTHLLELMNACLRPAVERLQENSISL